MIVCGLIFISSQVFADEEEPNYPPPRVYTIWKGNVNIVDNNIGAFSKLLSAYDANINTDRQSVLSRFFLGISHNNFVFLIGYYSGMENKVAEIKIDDKNIMNQYRIDASIPLQIAYRLSLFDILHFAPFVSVGYSNLEYSFTKNIPKDKVDIVDLYFSNDKKIVTLNSPMWFWDIGVEAEFTIPVYESSRGMAKEMNYFGLGVRLGYMQSYLTNWTTTSGIEVKNMPDKLFNGTYFGVNFIYESRGIK
jgi:hypothetical protein